MSTFRGFLGLSAAGLLGVTIIAAAAARRGDPDRGLRAAGEAFEHLYHRCSALLLAFIAARVRPTDRDTLHQEVWRRAWQHLPEQFHGGNFGAWLYQIARHALAEPEFVPDGRTGGDDSRLLESERRRRSGNASRS